MFFITAPPPKKMLNWQKEDIKGRRCLIFMQITEKNFELVKMIESLREEMIRVGLKEGLSSDKTVEISQKLDQYIANYQANAFLFETK